MTHVAYLSYDGLTDPLGQSQILPYLKGLSARGYRFTVISFEKEMAYEKNGADVQSQCDSCYIRWIPLSYHKKPPVLSTLFDLFILWQKIRSLHNDDPFTIIHCRSYLTSLIGQRAKRRWKVKFVFDMRGFWADERVEGGIWRLNNPVFKVIYKYFKHKELQFLTEADHVVSLTENARSEILSWGFQMARISVIPTCVDVNLFDPTSIKEATKQQLRSSLGITKGEFILLYLGSWGTWYLTDEMMSFFALWRKKQTMKFLIVTLDDVPLDKHEFRDDIIVRKASRLEVPVFISIATAAILFIKPSFSKKASSATKVGEILAMDVPVITNPNWGDIEKTIHEAGGFLVEPTNKQLPSGFPFDFTGKGVSSRQYAIENMSVNKGVDVYAGIYQDFR